MNISRRRFLAATGTAAMAVSGAPLLRSAEAERKRHIVTLSFDDGFAKSFARVAEIYEKHGLQACLNVMATGFGKNQAAPGKYIGGSPLGGFDLWNKLKTRGHEVMPHGYRHANLGQLPLGEAKGLIERCLEVFGKELEGFDPKRAVFNFPYNASTPELETWLSDRVLAFRTGGGAINPLPHAGQKRLTCTSFGPGNCEHAINREIERLLARENGWLIFNAHGLDEEGWGPIRATYLDALLGRLGKIDSVAVLPAGGALAAYAKAGTADSRR